MSTLKNAKIGIAVFAVVVAALFLHYHLPRTAVVQITGTDMKRAEKSTGGVVDQKDAPKDGEAAQIRDVRFINSVSRDGDTMVFRNEDTGWGWPPYFKFDSADLTAEAQSFATEPPKPWVRVKYYGWRIRIFSMFPNAVSLKVVGRDDSHFPLFNTVFLLLIGILGAVAYAKIKGRKRLKHG